LIFKYSQKITYLSSYISNCMGTDPVIAVAQQCTLPDDETQQEALLEDLAATLEEHGINPTRLQICDGDVYAQTNIHVKCPECRERLTLRGVRAGPENGVSADAQCTCGWTGRAVYRLIDLQENLLTDAGERKIDPDSCVVNRDMRVSYTPYGETKWEYRK
jgi:hypothetical protein